MAATSLTGSFTPSINIEYPYVVSVRNTGLSTENGYTVQLLQTGGVELGWVAGTPIAPQEIIEFTIPWTPTVLGDTEISGKIMWADDDNPGNNETAPFSVTVVDTGVLVAEIGTATTASHYYSPYGTGDQSFRQQYLYRADDLYAAGAAPGLLTALAFKVLGLNNCTPMTNYRIRLKHTDQAVLSYTFEPGEYTTVWQRATFMPATGWNTHTLDEPFMWNGNSNLLVDIITDPTASVTQNAIVYYSETDYNSCLRCNDASSLWGTAFSIRSNIRLFMLPTGTPALAISPESYDFDDVVLGYSSSQAFSLINAGVGTLSINSISISGNADFSLTTLPVLPAQIVPGAPVSFNVKCTPTSAGERTAIVTITDNLRLTYTVLLRANGQDNTIYELSYFQDFDGVSYPALPSDWNRLVEGSGYVMSTAGFDSPSLPNMVLISNLHDVGDIAMLIAPPLASTIPVNSVRVKLWGRGSGSSLMIGVMTDPADPATFTEVQTLTSLYEWAPYQVPLTSYTGNGRFIAFKLVDGTDSEYIHMDTVEFEMMGGGDLKTIALAGSSTPNVDVANEYTLSVHNNGSAAQRIYAVKLFDSSGVELATAAGIVSIAPGATVDVVVSWTPTTQGPLEIYGKVVLAGDVNPGNDASKAMAINVVPTDAISVTIGIGDICTFLPISFNYECNICQTLFYPDEIGTSGTIFNISLYNQFTTNYIGSQPITIWMGNTDQQNLDVGWVPYSVLTQVFDGMVNFPGGENTIVFPLQVPFDYTGVDNLVVMYQCLLPGIYYPMGDYFKGQMESLGRSRSSNDLYLDPANLTEGNTFAYLPKTTFSIVPESVGQIFGTVLDADGNPLAEVQINLDIRPYSTVSDGQGQFTIPDVTPGNYALTFSRQGCVTQSINIAVEPNQITTINCIMTTVANEDEIVPIAATALGGNYPNPFNPETTIHYDIKDATNVRLNVYNVKGQLVRSLVNTEQAAGRYRVIFDGRDDKGNPLSSGIYLYRFTAG
ncbi:MAG: choice-of-anchor D domain-containing protein, partial [Candidatus Cloacimonetes bacterium]|nr:choice-of-anchor D domain-containing protein [Candidatus Cloacimonadota bacterium]